MPDDHDQLIDDIYAAAWLPELWPQVLEQLTRAADGFGAVLFAADERAQRWTATPALAPVMADFVAGGWQGRNSRTIQALSRPHPGFVSDLDLLSPAQLARDPLYEEFLRPRGLGWCVGTAVPSPSRDLLVFSIERRLETGPMPAPAVAAMDPLRPHLARAALMSARLQLEQATGTTATLEALGLPAAVLREDGRVLATNALFNRETDRVLAPAHGRVSLADPAAAALLQDAIAQATHPRAPGVRSIPVAGGAGQPPLIAHLLPVRRQAHDIFARATTVLVLTPVIAARAFSTDLLQGLFDLTPAEARVARAIASGETLESLAATSGLSRETARSQLKLVFAKTGTRRQADLVALLTGSLRPK